ncbi:hypothetical protein ES319_A04G115000v1 [Gossypium barbadense]|uniref:GYF domain-containing protein n=1 Tax=Gossypium barbadense TaxID=3634 RepID=A0A5J5W730_GOSBA|nr:hypothetical protein ES319_A04G115000v1 [Gossypium barbadense]
MASINFNPFESWFRKPQNPIQPINLLSLAHSFRSKTFSSSPNFASINFSSPFNKKPKKPDSDSDTPGPYKQMLDQFFWECENLPDYRHTPEVEKILDEDPEIKENEKWWRDFRASPVVQFLARAEEIADEINRTELKENEEPFRKEDKKLWQAFPHPMPRKAIKTREESDDKFWDFTKQFFFGLWGFRQRPYPPGKPIDVAQAIGYKRLEKRYYDFIMRSGGWYYKDRLGRTRDPCELITLKTAWGAGIIDKHTFIWGEDMDEWAPIHMVYGLEPAIATWEVRLGAAATAFLHKLQKGIPPWVPLKGYEEKTYKQLQHEAIESKRIWPIPSHALFLWAGGSEMTTLLEADYMPNKYISKDLRQKLAKVIPGLRPWEVLSVEQAMDEITYGGEWYREPLGTYTTGPPYIRHWNKDVTRIFRIFYNLSSQVFNKLDRTVPGFNAIMEKVQADSAARDARRKEKREAQKKAEAEAMYGRRENDP